MQDKMCHIVPYTYIMRVYYPCSIVADQIWKMELLIIDFQITTEMEYDMACTVSSSLSMNHLLAYWVPG